MTNPRIILITGAYGIVGRALCQMLAADGIAHLAVGRVCPDWAQGLSIDLTDPALVERLAQHPQLEGRDVQIVHLAAAVPHAARYAEESQSADLTRRMDQAIFDLAQAIQASVTYISSCGLYDREDRSVKQPSEAALMAHSPYFAAKLDGEALFSTLEPAATCLRLSAPVGAGLPRGLVLPRFIAQLRETGAVQVWGTGRREQDFIDVRDVARLLTRAAQNPVPGTFNLARGVPTTMSQLAQTVIAAAGFGEVVYPGNHDPLDAHTARYDIHKTCSTFGWSPEISLMASCSTWFRLSRI